MPSPHHINRLFCRKIALQTAAPDDLWVVARLVPSLLQLTAFLMCIHDLHLRLPSAVAMTLNLALYSSAQPSKLASAMKLLEAPRSCTHILQPTQWPQEVWRRETD
jgi:hypothetical protein